MKKIYITGIAGLLGSNLAEELGKSYQICGADRVAHSKVQAEYDVLDLLDLDKLKESISRECPDILIHTAAMVNVDQCETEPEMAERINVRLTADLADICAEGGIKMIYISTDAVFDGKKEGLYVEEDAQHPINRYGKTKLSGEAEALECPESLILRTNIYGVNIQQKLSFGEWIVNSLLKGDTITLFTDIRFSPVLVNDLAYAIDCCIRANLSGIYHACASGGTTKYEFGQKIKEIFQIKEGVIKAGTSREADLIAPRSRNMAMSNQKLCRALGITMPTPEEGIRKFYQLYRVKGRLR